MSCPSSSTISPSNPPTGEAATDSTHTVSTTSGKHNDQRVAGIFPGLFSARNFHLKKVKAPPNGGAFGDAAAYLVEVDTCAAGKHRVVNFDRDGDCSNWDVEYHSGGTGDARVDVARTFVVAFEAELR